VFKGPIKFLSDKAKASALVLAYLLTAAFPFAAEAAA